MSLKYPYPPGNYTKPRGERKRKFYICDRRKCDVCSKECHHTGDVTHALYDLPDPWRKWEIFDSGMFEIPRSQDNG